MKVAICAGGTGGHMFPSCALYAAMKEKQHNVLLVTDTRGDVFCGNIDSKIVLETIRLSPRKIPSVLSGLFQTIIHFIKLWKNDTPDVVIGFGGLFTVVPLLVAKVFGAKVVICEQNAIVGKANAYLSCIADLKLSAFDISSWTKVHMPVREEFTRFAKPYFCDDKIKILVIGGSQGARSFSKIIPDALLKLDESIRKNVEIVQQISYENIEEIQHTYDQMHVKADLRKFISNIAEEMSSAQLVICRSGASTLSELVEMVRPAILIPYPNAAENHQYKNAVYFEKLGAAKVIQENENITDDLSKILCEMLQNKNVLKEMANNMQNLKNVKTTDLIDIIETIQKK